MKSRDPGSEPWDGKAGVWARGKWRLVPGPPKGRRRKSSRTEISETKGGQEIKTWSRIQERKLKNL